MIGIMAEKRQGAEDVSFDDAVEAMKLRDATPAQRL